MLGRVQFVKCLYLTEAHVDVDSQGAYRRAAAGRLDARYLRNLESLAAEQQWFTNRERLGRRIGYKYRLGPQGGAARRRRGDRPGQEEGTDGPLARPDRKDDHQASRDHCRSPRPLALGEETLGPAVTAKGLGWMQEQKLVPTGTGPLTRKR